MHLPYEEQLRAKRDRLQHALERYALLQAVAVEPVAAAEQIDSYRTRAKMVVNETGAVGLYARDSAHVVVDIPGCVVLAPAVRNAVAAVRDLCASNTIGVAPGVVLLAVDVREVLNQRAGVLLTLVLRRDLAPSREQLTAIAQRLMALVPGVVGIASSMREADSPRVLGGDVTLLAGEVQVPDRVGRAFHYATFGTFVQVHRGQAERLHDQLIGLMRERLGPLDALRVLELYGGSGAIGLDVALGGAQVKMVESYGPAATAAMRAAQEQGFAHRFRVVAGDAFAAGRHLVDGAPEPYDLVVVNPPRRGLAPTVRELIAQANPRAVAYISCEPDTLARDLEHLRRLGFAAERVHPYDMIPMTDEVESLAWLAHATVPAPAVLYEDEEILAVDKAAHEPTTPQAEHVGSLLGRVRALGDAAAGCMPVRRLDVGVSGVCVLARSAALAARWADALNEPTSRTIYMVACRGITPSKGSITRDLREQGRQVPARTRYRRLAVFSGHSILRAIPEQAHPHQVRRHLASIGHAVLGDERYGHAPTNRFFDEKHGLDRTFQHCVRIEVNHPTTGNRLVIESTLPGDLRTTLHRSGGSPTLLFLAQKHALGTRGYSSIPPAPERDGAQLEEPLDDVPAKPGSSNDHGEGG